MPFEDSSIGHTEVHTPTVVGATIDTDTYKYGGGSGKFDYHSVFFYDSADWTLGTDDFTISFWFRGALSADEINGQNQRR